MQFSYKAFGARVRQHRIALGLTQEGLAERAELSPAFLGHIERGTRIPSIDTLLALCTALDTSPDMLLGFDAAYQSTPSGWSDDERQAIADLLRKAKECMR